MTMRQYFSAAAASALIYDSLITLDLEVKYFWKRNSWNLVDVIYFLNRYVGIFGAVAYLRFNTYGVNLPLCNFTYWSRNLSNLVIIASVDYILIIRVLALYSRGRWLSIILNTLFAIEVAIKFALFVYLNLAEKLAVAGFTEDVTVCGADAVPPWQWGIVVWTIPIATGVILMALALYKATEFWKMSAGFRGFSLVKVLIQDQGFYFFFAIIFCVFDMMQYKLAVENIFVANLLASLGNPIFLCILGSRMLFNLKEAGELGVNAGTSYRLKTISVGNIGFADPHVHSNDVSFGQHRAQQEGNGMV
ncbi:uncharacterized protein FOMMEDRAFT_170811 [Fomitiporia mediterranea MF3/22]|uniref:uncharacterized protein n=1 Tax=Fomitiporia mediterranea (strain MF3/22) TaxID=694068 RepID=UPI00044079B8|nr:uncharacterized protein FOMMEDRAFT_170811 [Fomitiporia mediterranea MF3/22]EJC99070.1 hypothetical protein FOMMEDRAFT_170811 [Fomitiporia mediterranea MF3/22]